MTVAVETSTETKASVLEEELSETKLQQDYHLLPNATVSSFHYIATTHSSDSDRGESNQSISCSSCDSSNVCRICQDSEKSEVLRTLCNCTGSIAKYHVSCLEQWLSVSKSDICELCHGRFHTERKPKPFGEWIRWLRTTPQCRYIYGDLLCLFILTPLAMTSAALCGEGSWYYISVGQLVIASGLITLCAFLILLYIVWFILSMRYHLHTWRKWREENQVVKLVLPSTIPVSTTVAQIKETVV